MKIAQQAEIDKFRTIEELEIEARKIVARTIEDPTIEDPTIEDPTVQDPTNAAPTTEASNIETRSIEPPTPAFTMSYPATATMPSDIGQIGQTALRPRGGAYGSYMQGQVSAAPQDATNSVMHGHHVPSHDANLGAVMSSFSALAIPGNNVQQAATAMGPGIHHGYMTTQDGAVLFPGYGAAPLALGVAQAPDGSYNPATFQAQYPVQGSYPTPYLPYPVLPYTPGRAASFVDRLDPGHGDVPGLENRRGSYSTTESAPATPFFGSASDRGNGARVTVVDRSNYTTPSPQQLAASGSIGQGNAPKASTAFDADLDRLLKLAPAIPRAVPAVFTPPQHMKTLEQCLENRINGNRNVYIRGLHPTTDDDLLLAYASRFGEVEQSKAIIDTSTGACKGRVSLSLSVTPGLNLFLHTSRFGFAKFKDVRNSEKCIRAFYQLGYEVGFARVGEFPH